MAPIAGSMTAVMVVLGAVPNRPGEGRETYVHGRFFRIVGHTEMDQVARHDLDHACMIYFPERSANHIRVKGGIPPFQGRRNQLSWPMWGGFCHGYSFGSHRGPPRCLGLELGLLPDRASRSLSGASEGHCYPCPYYGLPGYSDGHKRPW